MRPDFFLDIVHAKTIKDRQINRLAISLASVEGPLAVSASRVAAKLKRIRNIVTMRRSQRREVGNEIWVVVVIDMDIPLTSATFCVFCRHTWMIK
jgi:hypothetical protein